MPCLQTGVFQTAITVAFELVVVRYVITGKTHTIALSFNHYFTISIRMRRKTAVSKLSSLLFIELDKKK